MTGKKTSWQANEISKNPRCIFVPVHSCYFTGCWLHCLGGGCGGKETGINQSWKTRPQFYDGHPANKKSKRKLHIRLFSHISPFCALDRMFPSVYCHFRWKTQLRMFSGRRGSSIRTPNWWGRWTTPESGSTRGNFSKPFTSRYRALSAWPRLSCWSNTFYPAVYSLGLPMQRQPEIWIVWHL